MLLKVGEHVVQVSNSLDSGEKPRYSSGSKLFAYGIIVALGGLRVNNEATGIFLNSLHL